MHTEHAANPHRDDRFISAVGRLALPALRRYFGATVTGVEHIPHGPALLVGNHSGGMSTPDTFLLCGAIRDARGVRDVPFGLAHDTALGAPLIGPLLARIGGVRADHESAARLFRDGRKVLVYPGGDLDAFRPTRLRHRVCFGGRRGYARLAARHQVPVVPVVAAGAHSGFLVLTDLADPLATSGLLGPLRIKTWPITLSIPWGILPGPAPPYLPLPTRILVEVMPPRPPPPTDATDRDIEAFDRTLRADMQHTLSRLAHSRRQAGCWAVRDWFSRTRRHP
ncbi:MAG: glycerol acyltransferase [Deltaproteobacteria bacterium]|nr:MAG: glycerol acyltransferase [Deltaproteobacteria bacterium]